MGKAQNETGDATRIHRSQSEKKQESGYDSANNSTYGGYSNAENVNEDRSARSMPEYLTGVGALAVKDGDYIVVPGDTLYNIALRNGVNLGELCALNGITILDHDTGMIAWKGQVRKIQEGDSIRIPEKTGKGIDKPTAGLLVKEAGKKATREEDKSMDGFFGTLLDLSANFLGPANDSQINFAIDINIPIYGKAVELAFKGEFEQKRKKDKLIEHKITLGGGFENWFGRQGT